MKHSFHDENERKVGNKPKFSALESKFSPQRIDPSSPRW